MKIRFFPLTSTALSATAAIAAVSAVLASIPSPVYAIALVTQRTALGGNDQLDWSSLGKVYNPFAPDPAAFLSNSFTATSAGGLGLKVEIPSAGPNFTPPFVFQTLPRPQGVPTNFALGDFLLFTGFKLPPTLPAVGNSNPITITFNKAVKAAGVQIAVDDTPQFKAFVSAFDETNTLLDTFQVDGTSSLLLNNSAILLGVRSETANIARLVFSSSVPDRAVAINTLSIVAPVPEPTFTFSLLAFGALGVGSALKRKIKPDKFIENLVKMRV